MRECSGISLDTLRIRGEWLTHGTGLQEQRPMGVSSFLWTGEMVRISLIPAALLTSILRRLMLTASVVVSIYKRQAPLKTHSSLEHHADVFIAEEVMPRSYRSFHSFVFTPNMNELGNLKGNCLEFSR